MSLGENDLDKECNLHPCSLTRSVSFEVARFESREATSADSLGRKPKDLLEIVRLAAKRRQQSARQQFAAVASRLNSATSKTVSEGGCSPTVRIQSPIKRSPSLTLRVSGFIAVLLLLIASIAADEVIDETAVRRWVARLDADRKADRLRAEEELLKLGPPALKWLPEPGVLGSRSAAEAVRRVRVKLERLKAESAVEASRLTVGGMRTVGDILPRLSQDTGNLVSADDLPQNLFAGLVELPEKPTFWQTIEALTQQQPVTWRCDGIPARLRLSPLDPKRDKSESPTDILAVTTTKAFRIALRSAKAREVVGESASQLMRLEFDITAEPRLRPLFLKCAAADVRVMGLRESQSTDATKAASAKPEAWSPFSTDSKIELTFGQGRRQLAFPVDYRIPVGGTWKSLAVIGQLSLETAAGEEPIDFPAGADSRGVSRRRGGVTVKILDWETDTNSNERTLTIRATVTYDTGGLAFESHRSWMLYNVAGLIQPRQKQTTEIELLKPTHAQSDLQPDGSIAVTYRFEKLPSPADEYGLRYVAPTLILDVPVEFEFRDVPLRLNRPE